MVIRKIGVIGSGAMGTGIAHISAQSGFEVVLYDQSKEATEKSKDIINGLFDKAIDRGRATETLKAQTLERLHFSNNIDSVKDADLIIEAIVEKLDAKLELFEQLEKICKKDAIFASNTSTMSITKLATAANRPERTAGLHFFNPAQVMKLVEIIRGYYTSDETVKTLQDYVKAIGKESIEVKRDTPGFVVNRLMLLQFREAHLVYEEGIASLEDIDKAMTLGLNHPMGPFTLMDFAGVDITYDSLEYLHKEFGQPHWAPPASLKRMVRAGRLGKKTKKGWYDYEGK